MLTKLAGRDVELRPLEKRVPSVARVGGACGGARESQTLSGFANGLFLGSSRLELGLRDSLFRLFGHHHCHAQHAKAKRKGHASPSSRRQP